MPQNFYILDLFAGAGGFSNGLSECDIFIPKIAVDIDESSLNTYEFNHSGVKIYQKDISIEKNKQFIINVAIKNNINCIIGGPPCQGFSLKGKPKGLKDPRNFLITHFLDIVKGVKPEIVIIENVKQMILSEKGYFVKLINKTLEELNYYVDGKVLNAKYFDIPQNRERAFILACKTKKVFLPKNNINNKKITIRDAISDLSYLESGEGEFKSDYKIHLTNNYLKKIKLNNKKLYNHKATQHRDIAIKKLKLIPPESDKSYLPKKLLGKQKFFCTWSRLKWDEISRTIDTRFDTPSNGQNSHPFLNRAITPREAARIQSFKDSFVFLGNKTSTCRQIGNAVPPNLAKAIGIKIKEQLSWTMVVLPNNLELICDDSNSLISKYVKDKKIVDHIITDPPYNISQSNNFSTLNNSKRVGINFGKWDLDFNVCSWIEDATKILKNGGSIIIFCSYLYISYIIDKLKQNKILVKDILRWEKKNPMPRNINRRYVNDTEYAIWGVKEGEKWIFNKPNSVPYLRPKFIDSVVSGNQKTKHPTQKSLKIMKEIIDIHTNKGDLIFDPFMGSGTTGIAAKLTNRKFIGCEIDKKYFEIAKTRLS